MTIIQEGEPLILGDLKATLMSCLTCGESSLYIGLLSGNSAEFVAKIHDFSTRDLREEHDIRVRGYKKGEPFPESDINPKTKFYYNF